VLQNLPPVAHTGAAPSTEPGLSAPMLGMRMLSIDVPTTPGLVRVDVPPSIAASGIYVELQQPNSHVSFTAGPNELNYGFGEEAEIICTLANDAAGISDAIITGYAVLPDRSESPQLTFTSLGGGKYSTKVPLASTEWKYIGVWGLRLQATGKVNGIAFERSVDTAFGYYPAHARMTGLGTPVIARGSDGLVDEISVDVDVETLADDRFSVRGILTFTGADGQEHPLAQAQTGQTINAGTGTITLHFQSSALALANADGPFHLRDVALVSQAYTVTQHRIGRALDISTKPVGAREIRYPREVSLQAVDLFENGDLEPRKQ
jgi:hypothetical protein